MHVRRTEQAQTYNPRDCCLMPALLRVSSVGPLAADCPTRGNSPRYTIRPSWFSVCCVRVLLRVRSFPCLWKPGDGWLQAMRAVGDRCVILTGKQPGCWKLAFGTMLLEASSVSWSERQSRRSCHWAALQETDLFHAPWYRAFNTHLEKVSPPKEECANCPEGASLIKMQMLGTFH